MQGKHNKICKYFEIVTDLLVKLSKTESGEKYIY